MSTVATVDEFGIPEDLTPTPSKKSKAIDPEDDRANWPTIHIDFEDGKPNYEFLAARGTKKDGTPFTHELKVQRGVDVQVPPSIVDVLRNAQEARYSQADLSQPVRRTNRSGIPWQLVNKGKYVK